jgi:hypothetical protein
MKSVFLILLFSTSLIQSDANLNKGVYGTYWDWNTYTEIEIIDTKHYVYKHKGLMGVGYSCSGKYEVENGMLKLCGKCKEERHYSFNGKQNRMPRLWKIEKDSLINKTEIGFPSTLYFKQK